MKGTIMALDSVSDARSVERFCSRLHIPFIMLVVSEAVITVVVRLPCLFMLCLYAYEEGVQRHLRLSSILRSTHYVIRQLYFKVSL